MWLSAHNNMCPQTHTIFMLLCSSSVYAFLLLFILSSSPPNARTYFFPNLTAHRPQIFVEATMQLTFLYPTQLPISLLVLLRTRTMMCRQHPRPVQRRHRLKKEGKLGSTHPEHLRCLTSKTQECCGLKHFGGQHRRPKGGRRCRRRCRSKAQTCKRRSPSA